MSQLTELIHKLSSNFYARCNEGDNALYTNSRYAVGRMLHELPTKVIGVKLLVDRVDNLQRYVCSPQTNCTDWYITQSSRVNCLVLDILADHLSTIYMDIEYANETVVNKNIGILHKNIREIIELIDMLHDGMFKNDGSDYTPNPYLGNSIERFNFKSTAPSA